VDLQNVYWSEGSMLHGVGCAVRKVPIGGGAVTTLLDEAFMADFAVDGVHVYFSEFAGNSIRRVPVDGGSNSLVADQATAWVLANNAANLYWLDLQQASIGGMSKTAGPSDWLVLPLDIAMDPFLAIEALRATESGVYFSESQSGSIYQVF
jgi:hypothetical protein